MHYDNAMIKVFEQTASLNSEEETMKLLCEFWAILQDMLKFTHTLDEYIQANTGLSKPNEAINVQLDVNHGHNVIKLLIDNKGKLKTAISTVLPKATNQLDDMANHFFRLQKIRKYIKEEAPCIIEFPELNNLETLANHELLIRVMALDLASVLNAYLHNFYKNEYLFSVGVISYELYLVHFPLRLYINNNFLVAITYSVLSILLAYLFNRINDMIIKRINII